MVTDWPNYSPRVGKELSGQLKTFIEHIQSVTLVRDLWLIHPKSGCLDSAEKKAESANFSAFRMYVVTFVTFDQSDEEVWSDQWKTWLVNSCENFDISDNWEYQFMRFIVTWQSRMTLQSIHDSCDDLAHFSQVLWCECVKYIIINIDMKKIWSHPVWLFWRQYCLEILLCIMFNIAMYYQANISWVAQLSILLSENWGWRWIISELHYYDTGILLPKIPQNGKR